MNLYDIAIARKLSGGGGGSGSSELSTAEVTLVNNTNSIVQLSPQFSNIVDHEVTEETTAFVINNEFGIDVYCDDGISAPDNSTRVNTVYLLSNKNFGLNMATGLGYEYSVDGNAEESYTTEGGENYPCIIVTGDCTITVSKE